VAGVPREAILPSLEDDSRIPAYCLKPIEAAQGGGEDPDPDEPEDPTAPLAFENADWTLAATPSGFSITIVSLPEDGGSAIQGVEYQVDTEDWVNLNSLESGEVTADPGEYQVRIRCFNSVGNSPDSEYKAVTVEVA
jgi:hypothetical protein